MTKASDNQFPSVLMVNTSNASISTSAPWNAQRLFFDADGSLKRKDVSGTVQAVEGGGTITFGGVSSTDTVTVASNFAVSDQGGGEARLDVFFPASGGGATFSGARVARTSGDVATSTTYTAIPFTSEEYDTDTYHDNSTNPSRLTVPSTGYYRFTASGYMTADHLFGFRKNGTTIIALSSNKLSAIAGFHISTTVYLSASDYVEFIAKTVSSTNIVAYDAGISPLFMVEKLG